MLSRLGFLTAFATLALCFQPTGAVKAQSGKSVINGPKPGPRRPPTPEEISRAKPRMPMLIVPRCKAPGTISKNMKCDDKIEKKPNK